MRNEIDVHPPELFEGQNELLNTPSKSVEPPNDDDVKLTAAGVCHQGLQSRPLFLGTVGPVLVDLCDGPATLSGEGCEGFNLDLGALFELPAIVFRLPFSRALT